MAQRTAAAIDRGELDAFVGLLGRLPMAGYFAGFRDLIEVPYFIRMAGATNVMFTEDEARENFDSIAGMLLANRIDTVRRSVTQWLAIGRNKLAVGFTSDFLKGGRNLFPRIEGLLLVRVVGTRLVTFGAVYGLENDQLPVLRPKAEKEQPDAEA